MFLLQEFDINIKVKKGLENVAAHHLLRLEKPKLEELNEEESDENFPYEYLMMITEEIPWFADIVNFLASDYIPRGFSHQQKKTLFSDLKYYLWTNHTYFGFVRTTS